jgi:hypothetical protein
MDVAKSSPPPRLPSFIAQLNMQQALLVHFSVVFL